MNKHSLIIGGSRGLGREVARQFSQMGHDVSIIGRRPPSETEHSTGSFVHAEADVTELASLDSALSRLLDGRTPLSNLVFVQRFKGEGDKWVGEMETSLTATKHIIEKTAARFVDGQPGAIVIVTSIADTQVSASQPVGYHVSKAGMLQMARYYAVALGPKGIRVNCVAPSTFVKDESRAFYHGQDALNRLMGSTIPLGRMGDAKDIANLVIFLCSDSSTYITGQHITIDGGVSLLSQEALARNLAGI